MTDGERRTSAEAERPEWVPKQSRRCWRTLSCILAARDCRLQKISCSQIVPICTEGGPVARLPLEAAADMAGGAARGEQLSVGS